MKKKLSVVFGVIGLLIVIGGIVFAYYHSSEAYRQKMAGTHGAPFAVLRSEDIAGISVHLLPPDQTIEIADFTEVVAALNEVVVYRRDNSYGKYGGQAVIYTITMKDGTQTTVNACNPFLVIDGVGYKTKYEPCEKLSQIANELAAPGFAEKGMDAYSASP